MNIKNLLFITVVSTFTTIAYAGNSEKPKASPTYEASASSGKQKTKASGTAKVSYYGPGFHGRKTANGERFNMHALTVAHKSLPFGTKVEFTCSQTGKKVVARVNDRGPYIHGRSFDLSLGAAKALGVVERGVAKVTYRIIN